MHLRTGLARLLATVVTAALTVVTTALPAGAHAEFVSSTPEAGTSVRQLPQAVTVSFTETVRTPAFVEVTGPTGTDVATGDATVRDTEISRPLGEAAEPGRYEVAYRITSLDGHPISGTVRFTLQGTGATGDFGGTGGSSDSAETAPTGTDGSGGGMDATQLVLLLAALLVGLAALAAGTKRALKRSVAMVDDGRTGRRPRG